MSWAGIPSKNYDQVKDIVRFYIAKALEINDIEIINYAYYEDAIVQDEMQVWVLYEDNLTIIGVMITKIGWFHDAKICSILIGAGSSIKEWEKFYNEVLEDWCRKNKVDKLEHRTRKGIGKVSTRHGYHVSEVICTKLLEY